MKYRRRRIKKKPIIVLVCLIILITVSIIFTVNTIKEMNYRKTYEYKLIQVGYSKEEYKIIEEKTNEEYMEYLLENDYDKMYIDIISAKYYIKSKLKEYIAYYEDNIASTVDNIVAIINTGADKEHYTDIKQTDTSKDYLMINNKYYKLPTDYKPDDLVTVKNWYSYGDNNQLRSQVYDSFLEMWNKAKEDNISLIVNSAYRSEKEQQETYDKILETNTKEYTDKKAARPGHSEHQTGLALDIITYGANGENFDQTDAFKWLENNAYKYGFILRYPKDKEYLTGYNYESWHYRYVGVEAATTIHNENITFDEYYAYYVENVSNS